MFCQLPNQGGMGPADQGHKSLAKNIKLTNTCLIAKPNMNNTSVESDFASTFNWGCQNVTLLDI